MIWPKAIRQYQERVRKREQRHPNWRQTYDDCNGMCQFPVAEGVVCGEVEGLEFHEIYGEVKENELKPQKRVLLDNYHHRSIHGEKWVNERHYPSMLQEDVALEIAACGGLEEWRKTFNIIDREVNFDLEINRPKYQSYFNYCSDS